MVLKQILIIILAFPVIAFSQVAITYETALDSLKNSNQIDSIYAEHEFMTGIEESIAVYSSSARLHNDHTAPKDYQITCVEKQLIPIGYTISTFFQKEEVNIMYFSTDKLLESIVYHESGKPIKVEVFRENSQMDCYFKLSEDKWLMYSPKNDWYPTDEGWTDYEMIKGMILRR